MIRKNKGSIEWLEFELFATYPELFAAVFLRHGGVSKDHYHSLNAGSGGQDPKENILANRKLIGGILGFEEFCVCGQPHHDKVALLPTKDLDRLEECDGMMTAEINEALLIKHADCQAAIFFDPKLKALACVHAGWRGQTKNIYHKTVEQMKRVFGCNPADILVAVSPSLGPNHAEFINYQTEWPKEYWKFQVRSNYFDLWAIGKHQLKEAGIAPEHMQFAEICTYSNPQDFYSYRREKPTGGHATIAYLKS
jgi:YfiH family protein